MNSPQDSSHSQAPASQQVSLVAQARVPTEHGTFTMKLFKEEPSGLEHVALVMGDIGGTTLVRVHSECMTGDVFGSLRCDCGPQLHFALDEIGKQGSGVVLYLRQEGRGIGLVNKMRAYRLQEAGADTVEANLALGFHADARDYELCKPMLAQFGITAVRLMTNNPRKIAAMEKLGVAVSDRVPLLVNRNAFNSNYLDTKAAKLGHMMQPEAEPIAQDGEL